MRPDNASVRACLSFHELFIRDRARGPFSFSLSPAFPAISTSVITATPVSCWRGVLLETRSFQWVQRESRPRHDLFPNYEDPRRGTGLTESQTQKDATEKIFPRIVADLLPPQLSVLDTFQSSRPFVRQGFDLIHYFHRMCSFRVETRKLPALSSQGFFRESGTMPFVSRLYNRGKSYSRNVAFLNFKHFNRFSANGPLTLRRRKKAQQEDSTR